MIRAALQGALPALRIDAQLERRTLAAEREEEQSQPQRGAAGGRSITREEDRKENRKRALVSPP